MADQVKDKPGRFSSFHEWPKRKDRKGRWVCVWCGKLLTGRKMKYCSVQCRKEVEIRCGVGVRWAVRDRDKEVCARCGCDCRSITNALHQLQFGVSRMAPRRYKRRGHLADALGLTPLELDKSLWEAHHKKAVKDGGGACGLDNFETICIWCHKKETATQAADAAHVRRVERQDQLPLLKGESTSHG